MLKKSLNYVFREGFFCLFFYCYFLTGLLNWISSIIFGHSGLCLHKLPTNQPAITEYASIQLPTSTPWSEVKTQEMHGEEKVEFTLLPVWQPFWHNLLTFRCSGQRSFICSKLLACSGRIRTSTKHWRNPGLKFSSWEKENKTKTDNKNNQTPIHRHINLHENITLKFVLLCSL